jgi:hypothetical protein
MPVSIQHLLNPQAVLETIDTVATEDALYRPALSGTLSAILLERESLRVQFNFRALAVHLEKMNAAGKLPHGSDFRVSLTASELAAATAGANSTVRAAAAQCLHDLDRMEKEGYTSFIIPTFRPVQAVHKNISDESVVCNLWGENLVIPHPDDVRNKQGSFYDPEDGPRLKDSARVFTVRPGNQLRFMGMMHDAGEGVWHGHIVTSTPAVSLQGNKMRRFL